MCDHNKLTNFYWGVNTKFEGKKMSLSCLCCFQIQEDEFKVKFQQQEMHIQVSIQCA